MSKVTVLGLGAMGARMAARLIQAGNIVTVWNRTTERASALVAAGAALAPDPRTAAQGAEFVIAMVRDDEASQAIWLDADTGALAGLEPDAVAIECSTLTVAWVRTLAAHHASAGRPFLEAPVAGSRPQAEAGQLIWFVGGDAATLSQAEHVLTAMGSAVHHAGAAGEGAAVKLAVNALFGIQVAALAEIVGGLKRSGADAARLLEILGSTPVCSAAAKGAIASMLSGAFPPMFPVELVEKDLDYARVSASAAGAATPMTEAAQAVFRHAIAAGHGRDNLTGVVRLYD